MAIRCPMSYHRDQSVASPVVGLALDSVEIGKEQGVAKAVCNTKRLSCGESMAVGYRILRERK